MVFSSTENEHTGLLPVWPSFGKIFHILPSWRQIFLSGLRNVVITYDISYNIRKGLGGQQYVPQMPQQMLANKWKNCFYLNRVYPLADVRPKSQGFFGLNNC
jgi:hypothetical protein